MYVKSYLCQFSQPSAVDDTTKKKFQILNIFSMKFSQKKVYFRAGKKFTKKKPFLYEFPYFSHFRIWGDDDEAEKKVI